MYGDKTEIRASIRKLRDTNGRLGYTALTPVGVRSH